MKKIGDSTFRKIIEWFLIVCILIGVIVHIVPYFYNRCLSVDEAMQVSSICTRSFSELLASPLDWGQSAPVVWLFIEKIMISIFGSSELILRIWSLFSMFGCLILIYLLLNNKVEKKYILFVLAVFSLTGRYIYYGNEVKPYMWDNLCCLFTLLVWQKYKEQKIDLCKMIFIYAGIIWCSFSAVFFVGACMIIECINIFKDWLKSKEFNKLFSLGLCSTVLLSFIFNYIFWLSKTSENAGGADYWSLLRFPLFPTTLADLKLILKMAAHFFDCFPKYCSAVFIIIFLIYVAKSIKYKIDKSKFLSPFILSLVLLFVASYFGFYPIQNRLVQIYAIVVLVIVGFECNDIELYFKKNKQIHLINYKIGKYIFTGILIGCLVLIGKEGCKYLFPKYVYKSGSEVSESINYLQHNLTPYDVIYIFNFSIPVYSYMTEYQVDFQRLKSLPENPDKLYQDMKLTALPFQIEDTIYGQQLVTYDYNVPYSYDYEINLKAIEEDLGMIKNNDSVYIFASHREEGIPILLEELRKYGTVETLIDNYNTRLYHFARKQN